MMENETSGPDPISGSVHTNVRPVPNRPLRPDYLRHGVYKDEGCVKDRVLLPGVCNAACGPEFG